MFMQQDEWYRRAELALNKGDDDLAREALKRRKAYAVSLSAARATFLGMLCWSSAASKVSICSATIPPHRSVVFQCPVLACKTMCPLLACRTMQPR